MNRLNGRMLGNLIVLGCVCWIFKNPPEEHLCPFISMGEGPSAYGMAILAAAGLMFLALSLGIFPGLVALGGALFLGFMPGLYIASAVLLIHVIIAVVLFGFLDRQFLQARIVKISWYSEHFVRRMLSARVARFALQTMLTQRANYLGFVAVGSASRIYKSEFVLGIFLGIMPYLLLYSLAGGILGCNLVRYAHRLPLMGEWSFGIAVGGLVLLALLPKFIIAQEEVDL